MSSPYQTICNALRSSTRPLFIWGAGVRDSVQYAKELSRKLSIPVVTTWGAVDLAHDVNHLGTFGTHGVRAANLAVQNADLLVSFGCRLDTKATGTPSDFAPKAQIVMVDVDDAEIDKMDKVGREVIGVNADCHTATQILLSSMMDAVHEWERPWLDQCAAWKKEYVPKDDPEWVGKPYELMKEIAKHTTPDDIIVSDTGNTYGWIMQGFPFKGERFIHASNFTPMGYGLGAAVGAAFASGRRVIAVVGDGGALMSIQELATIARHNLDIKIILLDNGRHSMCCFTQDQWLGGKYPATTIEGGLGFPDWRKTAEAFGIDNVYAFDEWIAADRPQFMSVKIDPAAHLAYQVKYGDKLA